MDGSEHGVGQAAVGRSVEMGIDVLPDHIPRRGHLEDAAEVPFGDERVAILQSPRTADERAEEVSCGAILIFP
jgi:hypothetical protein